LQTIGYNQFILSAMEQQQLEKTVNDHHITHYFEGLFGLDNHFAMSKVEIGKSLIKRNGLYAERILMIGDTIHDYEVAQAIGCKCILVPNGHQSKERLLISGANVVESLAEIDFF
jgi:phosphoglycolate phosphatase